MILSLGWSYLFVCTLQKQKATFTYGTWRQELEIGVLNSHQNAMNGAYPAAVKHLWQAQVVPSLINLFMLFLFISINVLTGRQGCRLDRRPWPGDTCYSTEGKEAIKKAAAMTVGPQHLLPLGTPKHSLARSCWSQWVSKAAHPHLKPDVLHHPTCRCDAASL